MASLFLEHISPRWLAAPLAIWGKLPSHGDFLRHRTSSAQAQDWQDWVSRVWSQRAHAPQRTHANRRGEPGWVSLEPRQSLTPLTEVPVAFVMPAGSMPGTPRHCVQGVLLASQDQIGRPCPLIIYQQVAPGWLRRSWADSQGDMLYWLARIAARAHGADRSWEDLTRAVDCLWQLHQPGWKQWLGAPLAAPTSEQLGSVLRQYCEDEGADVARGLRGVQHMPWANWPAQILRTDQPAPAFWQQDLRGGYVNASDNLPALWRAQP